MEKLYYKEYYTLERKHWWFKARLKILEILIQQLTINFENLPKILNAGAGTGATSSMLKKHGTVTSLEYDKDCSLFLEEILNEKVLNASLTDLPLDNDSFDIICAFDVIEHIKEDRTAIQEINRTLKENGYVFITVPAFKILWGKHDEVNHHFRRYRLKEVKKLLSEEGFKIKYSSYFNFLLFIPILLIRILSKVIPKKPLDNGTGSDFEKFNYNFLNDFLYYLFVAEKSLLKRKVQLPFGVSALVIAQKNYT